MCMSVPIYSVSPYSLVTVSLFPTSVTPNYRGITSSVSMVLKNLQTLNAGEGVEKREPSYTADRNVNWYIHYGEQYGGSLKKLKIELSYDPAISCWAYTQRKP